MLLVAQRSSWSTYVLSLKGAAVSLEERYGSILRLMFFCDAWLTVLDRIATTGASAWWIVKNFRTDCGEGRGCMLGCESMAPGGRKTCFGSDADGKYDTALSINELVAEAADKAAGV